MLTVMDNVVFRSFGILERAGQIKCIAHTAHFGAIILIDLDNNTKKATLFTPFKYLNATYAP